MARINVFLKDDLLKAVDSEAAQAGTNRSALIQAALAAYLENQRKAREEAESQRRMDDACKRMDVIAEKLGAWDPVSIIREFRDTRYGGAPRTRRRARVAGRS
ncbi:MAG: ribbon-helix-helix protein, CopG family [Candidatus Rokubacteria bacterium]|nr:ribbon-helix-helix protein, CopG family [Candidatus Rokubacteria bacterium]